VDGLPKGFAKAVTILEEAVRGFTIGGIHGRNFWADQTRDAFVSTPVFDGFGPTPVSLDGAGAVVPNPSQSQLVQRLKAPTETARMPKFRPAVPAPRIAYLEQWISEGCPDDDPADEIGVHHERLPADEAPPTP
jgi:hypothetical protein